MRDAKEVALECTENDRLAVGATRIAICILADREEFRKELVDSWTKTNLGRIWGSLLPGDFADGFNACRESFLALPILQASKSRPSDKALRMAGDISIWLAGVFDKPIGAVAQLKLAEIISRVEYPNAD